MTLKNVIEPPETKQIYRGLVAMAPLSLLSLFTAFQWSLRVSLI